MKVLWVIFIIFSTLFSSLSWGQCRINEIFNSLPTSCGGSVDLVNNSSPQWGLDESSITGNNYLGFHPQLASLGSNNSTIPNEFISLSFAPPLIVGTSYDLTFFYAVGQLNGLASHWAWASQNMGNNPGYIKAWLGYSDCDTSHFLCSTPILMNESAGWNYFSFSFVAPASYTRLILSPIGLSPGTMTPYMLLDSVTLCESTILPIELSTFEGLSGDTFNELSWSTLSEIDSDRFDIFKSDNGRTYYQIGSVPAKGKSTTMQYYQFKDDGINKSMSYYKLQYVDLDGNQRSYGPISINRSGANRIYPNPFSNEFNISFDRIPAERIMLFSISGEKVLDIDNSEEKSTLTISQDELGQITPGTYILQCVINGQIEYHKIIKH